jgi:phage terminase small subunit
MNMRGELVPAPPPSRRALVKIKRDNAVRRMCRRKYRECDWLEPFDREMVEQWATARRRRLEIEQILRDEGMRLPDGTPHPMLSEARHWDARETQLSDRLGFNPKSRMDIRANAKQVKVLDLEAVRAELNEESE